SWLCLVYHISRRKEAAGAKSGKAAQPSRSFQLWSVLVSFWRSRLRWPAGQTPPCLRRPPGALPGRCLPVILRKDGPEVGQDVVGQHPVLAQAQGGAVGGRAVEPDRAGGGLGRGQAAGGQAGGHARQHV